MMAIISIIISLFALAVAFLSLYYTHLRSANIVLGATRLGNRTDIEPPSTWKDGIWPINFSLFYKLHISNFGSRSGSFEGLDVSIKPKQFKTLNLEPSNQIFSTEKVSNSYKLLNSGERVIINDKEVIPIMVKLFFSPKFPEAEYTEENFRKMWAELLELKDKNEPIIEINYKTLEINWRGKVRDDFKQPVLIENISKDVINVFVGRLTKIAEISSHKYNNLAKQCLGK